MDKSKKIINLVIPLFLEMLFLILLGTCDTLMITNYSEQSVASIGNANTVLNFLTVLFNICSVGVSIVVSQYIGAKQEENSKKVLSQGILFNLILSVLIALLFLLFNKQFLSLIHTPDNILNEASNYIMLIAFTLPFQSMTSVMSANLKAHSKPFYITIASFVVNIINVGLNYVLIYGKLGLPELGYLGAAIATMTCHILTFIYAVIITKVVLNQNVFSLKYSKKEMMEILKIGGPSALENICYNVSQIFVLAEVNKLLTNMVIARTYINTVSSFIYIFSVAFGSANAILVGYSVGKHDYIEARKNTRKALYICYPILIVIVSIINIFGKQIFGIFTKNDEILNAICKALPILFLLESGRCINIIYINALKSAGDTIYPVICAVICMFLFASFGSFLFTEVIHFGLIGIYLASGLDEFIRGLLILLRFRTNKWENKGIIKENKTV